jgi:hypothetical protein
MKSKQIVLGLVLVLSALILSACGPPEAVTVLTTDVTPEGPVDTEFAAARDAAMAYLRDRYGEQAPPSDLAWATEPIELAAPEEMGGSKGYRYTANSWVAMVTYPVRGPRRIVYRVRVANEIAGFRWEGHVDGEGHDVYDASEDIVAARDAALAYIRERYGDQAPASGLTWMEELTTPQLLPGGINYRFTAQDWAVTVDTAVVPPEMRVYQVTVDNPTTGFYWEGRVDAEKRVTEGPEIVLTARDAALAYIREHYAEQAPTPDLTWTGGRATPEGLVGGMTFQYTAGDWVVTVSYPVVAPEAVIYRIVVANQATGLRWEGELDAEQRLREIAALTGLPGWLTYTNEKHGYSFQYPADCFYGPMPAGCKKKPPEERPPECLCFLNGENPDEVFLQALVGEAEGFRGVAFSISHYETPVYNPPPDTELIEWLREQFSGMPQDIPDEPNTEIDGIPAVSVYSPRSPMAPSCEEIYFTVDNKLFRINMLDVDNKDNKALYDQMLSTLKVSVETPTGGLPVVGWYGNVISLPPGSQYDDYLSLMPEGTGEIGVEGINEAIEAQIVALRNKEEPGKYAHFWGTLNCPALDYGGCELVVTRLRVDGPGPFFDPDPVEGWKGTIHSGPSGPRSGGDDYLVLVGDFPMQYGIDSLDPTLAAQLESLRDTGTVIRVWGELTVGIPDWNGTRIQVNRIEVVGEPPSPLVVADETVDGWIGAVGKYPWGSQFEGFFERNDGERFGIDAKDADAAVRQQIEAYRWTGARVQVWGRLLTNVPDVNGRQILVERIEAISGPEEDSRNLALFASTSASSVYPSDRWGTYHAWSAIDGRVESPWVEGVAGSGIGEWITLTFPGTVEVWGIGLDVGYDRDADIFYANNRIKRATFVFSNGEQVTLDFSDTRGVQMVHLARAPGPNIETTYVKMVIEEVYPGSRYDDTCLGEIEVWGRTR